MPLKALAKRAAAESPPRATCAALADLVGCWWLGGLPGIRQVLAGYTPGIRPNKCQNWTRGGPHQRARRNNANEKLTSGYYFPAAPCINGTPRICTYMGMKPGERAATLGSLYQRKRWQNVRLPNALHARRALSWRIWWAVGGWAGSQVSARYSPGIRRVYAQTNV